MITISKWTSLLQTCCHMEIWPVWAKPWEGIEWRRLTEIRHWEKPTHRQTEKRVMGDPNLSDFAQVIPSASAIVAPTSKNIFSLFVHLKSHSFPIPSFLPKKMRIAQTWNFSGRPVIDLRSNKKKAACSMYWHQMISLSCYDSLQYSEHRYNPLYRLDTYMMTIRINQFSLYPM